MDLFSPLRLGVHVATDALKLATLVPRLILHQLQDDGDQQRYQPTDDRPAATGPAGTRPAGTRPSSTPPASRSRATPGRATSREPGVQRTTAAPEPTSAAGASGGVAGTAAAPGAAAAAGAPDPTAASATTRARRTVRQGERRAGDVRPPRSTPARSRTEPSRAEVDRRRAEQREETTTPETTLAETEGSAAPAATIHVDEPWDGYGQMKAPDIVDRVGAADQATKAVVRLYEQTHRKRKSILDATGS
jgi:hypothetical protein